MPFLVEGTDVPRSRDYFSYSGVTLGHSEAVPAAPALCCLSDGERLQLQDEEDDSLCRICMDAIIDCVLLECGHMVTCTKCGKRMSECPICRQYVVRAVHVFKS